MTPRHRTPAVEVEHALVSVAAELLRAEGPHSLSIRRVATAAGVAPMGVYNRFGGKSGLIDALFQAGFRELERVMTEIPTDDIEAGLRTGMRAYRDFALSDPARYSLMFDSPIADFTPSEAGQAAASAAFAKLVDKIALGQTVGRIIPGDAVEIAQRVWACGHGAVSLELRGIGFVSDREAHYGLLVDTLIRGLMKHPD